MTEPKYYRVLGVDGTNLRNILADEVDTEGPTLTFKRLGHIVVQVAPGQWRWWYEQAGREE